MKLLEKFKVGAGSRVFSLLRLRVLPIFVVICSVYFSAFAEVKLGDWHVIGPFKDEEFGNIDRSLEYKFDVETDALAGHIDLSRTYMMQPFPGYLDLERKWEVRKDYADGFYNLLPRGPAPSRMESVYLYRTIWSDNDQTIQVNLRMQDFHRIWLNGEHVFTYNWLYGSSRYPRGDMRPLNLKKGMNHLLIKNVSRWAEHGFAFAVEGIHDIKDPYYVDLFAADKLTDKAYVSRFKFKAEPIPMFSPDTYELEETLASFKATPAAAAYDAKLTILAKEAAEALKSNNALDVPEVRQRLEGVLDDEVRNLPPLVFITKPLHDQNAIAPYATAGALPAAIMKLDPSKPGAEPDVIFSQPDMRIFDMSLSFDGKTIFFSAKTVKGGYAWDIYEIGVDGKGLKQITNNPKIADISPVELPSGRLAYISTQKGTWVECQGKNSGLLYSMARDGSDIRLLSANIDSDHSPRVTNDGRIMFTRWDYGVEKNVFARHGLWTVNPDGTNFQLVYGNTIEDPGGFWWASTIPDRPEIVAVFGPHHNHHAGMIGLVWNGKGPEAPRGVGYRWITREVPVYGDKTYPDGYRTPWPLNEKQFLVSYGGEKHRPVWDVPKDGKWRRRPEGTMTPLKLLYLDAYGNERLIYEAPDGLSVYNGMPVKEVKRPPVIPDKIPPMNWVFQDPEEMNRSDGDADLTATMLVQDVYQGISKHVKRGDAKYIAVMEQVQKSRVLSGGEAWGHSPLIGRGTVHVRRLNGLVPIEEDGSAFFKVPALRSVSLNVLNADGKTLMRMGSDIHVMPGENLSCIGCHEQRENGYGAAPPALGKRMALSKPPVEPKKQGWGTDGLIDYVTVVQPVWDNHCVECHSGPNPPQLVNMTDDKTRFFNQSYDQLVDRDIVDHLSVFSLDHDEGTPNTVGAIVSRIDEFMSKEHCGTEISWGDKFRVYCWIDANVPYYGTYDSELVNGGARGLGMRDTWFENKRGANQWATKDLKDMFDRRCLDCHEREALNMSWLIPAKMKVYSDIWGDKALSSHGMGRKWTLVQKLGPEFRINMTNPEYSALLQAPLSKGAGGAGFCKNADGSPVFADKSDPDYVIGLEAIKEGSALLYKDPRVDMMGKERFLNPPKVCLPCDNPGLLPEAGCDVTG